MAVTSTYGLHEKVSVKAAFISEFQKETRTLLKYSQKIPVTVPGVVLLKNFNQLVDYHGVGKPRPVQENV